jgi:uncharacterized membrane protein YdbT with pleckstrin-like domain
MVFKSKVDAWLVGLTLGPYLVVIGALVVSAARASHLRDPRFFAVVAVFVAIAGLLVLLFRSTDYRIVDGLLVIRCGVFRWRVPVDAITSVTPTRSPAASPALSLDRLRIEYQGRAILVSPRDKDGFIRSLRAANPAIRT